MASTSSLHILVLVRRDWTHPEGGAAAAALRADAHEWVARGHRVTIIASRPRGTPRLEEEPGGPAVRRTGSPRTVLVRGAYASWRGCGRDADVVLEVVTGRTFLTPLWRWLAAPRVLLVERIGAGGRIRRLAERVALALLYRETQVVTPSLAARDDLIGLGVPPEALHVAPPGAGPDDPDGALAVLARSAAGARVRLRDALSRSETAKAGGLAAASLANNAIQLLFTVVFTRLLGASGYGSLAALISAFLILLVAGAAVQAAAAREAALGRFGTGEELAATLSGWTRALGVGLALAIGLSVLLRHPLGQIMGVPEYPWAAAAVVPTGVLWLAISLQRGVLQGLHAYGAVGSSIVGEGFARLFFGLVLVAAGAGVTGAYLGTPLALVGVGAWLWVVLRRRTGSAHGEHGGGYGLARLVRGNGGPLAALFLLAVLQNIDVIVAKHQLGGARAGSYAAAAVAAKAVVWVAVGLGLHLLPEATRRAAAGLDPRGVLLRALAMIGIVAAPALLIFALVPHLLLRVAFGPRLTLAADALILLGLAMTLLAVAYLTVQYLIALGRRHFLWVLAVVAVAEPLLLTARSYSIMSFATIVLALQCVAALSVLALGLRAPRGASAGAVTPPL